MSEIDRTVNYQADLIELTLNACSIPVRVAGGVVAHRFVRHTVQIPLDRRPEDVIRQQQNLSARLGVSCTVHLQDGTLVIDVPLERATTVFYRDLVKGGRPEPLVALLGVDSNGQGLKLRLNSPDVAHVLAAGTTGSGKTALVRAMLVSLASGAPPRQLQFVVIDPRGRSYQDFSIYPHLAYDIVADADHALYVLEQLLGEGEKRERDGQIWPWRVIVLEELADLILAGGKPVERLIARLVQRGRHAGYTVIACAQKPTVDAIGSLVKANFPTRIVGAVTSSDEAKLATGRAGSGAEELQGRGDLLLVVKSELVRFQAAYITPDEVRRIGMQLATYHPSYGDHRRDPQPPPGWRPRVIQGGRGRRQRQARILADARRLLADHAWVANHIQGQELAGDWQAAAGAILDRPNVGGHHAYLKAVGEKALELSLTTGQRAGGE
jgi:S-DNA-T family DNA segregation ATPase FtsK/SpoIIIE